MFSRPFIDSHAHPPLFIRAFDLRHPTWLLTDNNAYVRFAEFFADNNDEGVYRRLLNIPNLLQQRRNIREASRELFNQYEREYTNLLYDIKFEYIPKIEKIADDILSLEEYEERAKGEATNLYQCYIQLVDIYIQMINL